MRARAISISSALGVRPIREDTRPSAVDWCREVLSSPTIQLPPPSTIRNSPVPRAAFLYHGLRIRGLSPSEVILVGCNPLRRHASRREKSIWKSIGQTGFRLKALGPEEVKKALFGVQFIYVDQAPLVSVPCRMSLGAVKSG
jgi:hypothetical protein